MEVSQLIEMSLSGWTLAVVWFVHNRCSYVAQYVAEFLHKLNWWLIKSGKHTGCV